MFVNNKGAAMRKYFSLFCIVVFLFSSTTKSFAKTYGWLISTAQNKAQKLDVDANKIVLTVNPSESLSTSTELQTSENAIVASKASGLLFVIYDKPGRHMGQGVKVYDLKQLSFKKDIGVTSKDPDYELPKIIPPLGNNFIVAWWDSSKGMTPNLAIRYSIFSKSNLSMIGDQSNFPIDVYDHIFPSFDGSRLYAVSIDMNNVSIFDSKATQLIETISIENLWAASPFGKGIEDYSNDRVLFAENAKINESAPNNFNYFIYNISTKNVSQKIPITETGSGILSKDSSKIIILEISAATKKSLNMLDIYDSISGKKLKHLDLSSKYSQVRRLRGDTISADGSKLYLIGKSTQSNSYALLVIDLKTTYSVVAEIPSIDASSMIIYEE